MRSSPRPLREGFPLSSRLIREIHGVLMSSGRGRHKEPWEFRRSQNWIGGSRPGNATFVPPPHMAVPDCMSDLERFLHATDDGLPALVRAGLAHVQFETIHPFRADRGRIDATGRRAGSALRVHEALKARPILSMPDVCNATSLSLPAASSAMDLLVELGIAKELTGKRRNRLFVYDRYLAILNEGTEPP